MAYDFPASPTPDQEFTPVGGPTYIWKSPRWFVKGGTMGGDGGSGVVDWAAITGKPSTFPPTVPIPWTDVSGKPATFPPTLPIAQSDVTGLVTGQAAQDTAISGKVAKTGDTMTGLLNINTGGTSGIVLNATGATSSTVLGSKGAGVPRWNLKLGDEGAESGGNAGTNFVLNRYNDDGSGGAPALTINRATKAMVVYGDLTAAAALYSTAFASSTTTAVLCTTTAGTVTLRPNGAASTVNQVALTSAGVFTLATTPAPGDNSLQAATTAFVTAAVAAGGGAVSWASITGKPSTFPPTVPIAQVDITNLLTDLTARLLKAGDTMTGDLAIQTAAGTSAFNLRKGVGAFANQLNGFVGASQRWGVQLGDTAAESSGNAGSNLGIYRYDDAGGYLGNAVTIMRSTGNMILGGTLSIAGTGYIAGGAGGAQFNLNKAVGAFANSLLGQTGGVSRWNVQLGDTAAESSGNAGTNFGIYRYTDAGAFIDAPLTINRATGVVALAAGATVGGVVVASLPIAQANVTNLVGDLAAKVGEASNDGSYYARKGLTWQSIIPDPASDNTHYGKRNNTWRKTAEAALASAFYIYRASYTSVGMVAGEVRVDNSYWPNITKIWVHGYDADTTNWANIISAVTAGWFVLPQQRGYRPNVFILKTTGVSVLTGDVYEIPVTWVGGLSGNLNADQDLNLSFVPGASGGGGGAATAVADTAPGSPTQGQLWFDSSTANLYLYYDDGTSAQWIQVNATGAA